MGPKGNGRGAERRGKEGKEGSQSHPPPLKILDPPLGWCALEQSGARRRPMSIHRPTQLNSAVESRRRCVLGFVCRPHC